MSTTTSRFERRDFLIAGLLAAFATVFLLTHITRGALPMEDAFMLLRYSANMAHGHGIVWNVGEHPVEGATDFLYMALLGGLGMLTHASVISVGHFVIGVSQVVTVTLLYVAARRLFDAPRIVAAFFSILCAVGTAFHFVDTLFSAPFFGLMALLAWVGAYTLVYRGVTSTRALLFSLAALLMGLTRPEGVFIACFMLAAALYGTREHRVRLFAIFAGVFLLLGGAYFAWRVHYFGYLLPNPFYVKHGFNPASIRNGARELILLTLPALPFLGLGAVSARGRRTVVMLLLVFVPFVAMWGSMSLDNNGYNRFQYVMIAVILLSAADACSAFLAEQGRALFANPGLRRAVLGFAACGAALSVFYVLHLNRDFVVNPGAHDLGLRLQPMAAHGDSMVTTEAGALPFYAEWRVIDAFGFNDSFIAHHDGRIPASYLDTYKPEIIMYKASQFGPLGLSEAELQADSRHFSDRLPVMASDLRSYAVSHGYLLAAIYGAHSCDYHYFWVRPNTPDTAAIVSAIQDYRYDWQYGGQSTFNFKDYDLAKTDTCKR